MHPLAELGLDLERERERAWHRLPHWDPRLWQPVDDGLHRSPSRDARNLSTLGIDWARRRLQRFQQEATPKLTKTRPSHGRPEQSEDGRKGGGTARAGSAHSARRQAGMLVALTSRSHTPAEHASTRRAGRGWAARTGKEEDVEVGLTYFGKRFLSPYLGRWVSADPLGVHAAGEADLNLYAYVRGAVLKNIDPLGLDDQPTSVKVTLQPNDEGETNVTYEFSEARVHAKPPRPAVTDRDKINDELGLPREDVQNGLPTAEAVDDARMPLPSGIRDDRTLKPIVGPTGVVAWATESGGTTRRLSLEGEDAGYVGEKPLVPTVSPVDVIAPAAARGLWALGGRVLRLVPAASNAPRDLFAEAVTARDSLARELSTQKHPPATVAGGYSPSSGRVVAAASRGGGRGCAEGACSEMLGHPRDIQFTPAVRPRTGKPVDVCPNCESTYGRGAFPHPATRFRTDTKGE